MRTLLLLLLAFGGCLYCALQEKAAAAQAQRENTKGMFKRLAGAVSVTCLRTTLSHSVLVSPTTSTSGEVMKSPSVPPECHDHNKALVNTCCRWAVVQFCMVLCCISHDRMV